MKLVVNIPCYNEEKTLPLVLAGIPKKIPHISEIAIHVIDDGSTDNTALIAAKAGCRVVIHKKNLGLGRTFKDGINSALMHGADIIVNIDGDGQFNSNDIPKLIEPILRDRADMVTCTRFKDPRLVKNMPFVKKIGNRMFTSVVNRITGRNFTDTQCGFRAYSREAALRLSLFGRFTYTQEVFLDLVEKGMKIEEVALPVVYHQHRKSKMVSSVPKYAFRSMGIIIRATRDIGPLSFFGMPALIMFIIGFLGLLSSFVYWLITSQTTPVKTLFLASGILVVIAVMLGVLALIADMLLRMRLTQEELLYRMKKKEYERK